MEKLPISLVTVVHNGKDSLKKLIERHKDLVTEIVVVDQGSTDGTYELALELADFAVQRRKKGFPEPDREFSASLAKCPYILVLDDDEHIAEADWPKLKEAIETETDVFWFKRTNLIDGLDISDVLGDDLQVRMWKRGAVRCSPVMHKYPDPAGNAKALFLDLAIVHERTFEGMKRSNLSRNNVASPQVQQMQNEFMRLVEERLRERNAKG